MKMNKVTFIIITIIFMIPMIVNAKELGIELYEKAMRGEKIVIKSKIPGTYKECTEVDYDNFKCLEYGNDELLLSTVFLNNYIQKNIRNTDSSVVNSDIRNGYIVCQDNNRCIFNIEDDCGYQPVWNEQNEYQGEEFIRECIINLLK